MKRTRLGLILFLPLIVIVCLIIAYLAGLPLNIPGLAAETFGPPAQSLSLRDKIYLSTFLLLQKNDLTDPHFPFGSEVHFQIDLGESAVSVSNRLYEQDLIPNPGAFRNYLVYTGLDTQIQAGEYTLNPALTPIEMAWVLLDSTPKHVDFGILAGWRVEEIAAALPNSGINVTPDEFVSYVHQNNLEGFLYPGIYSLPREISTERMVLTFVNAFDSALTHELTTGFSRSYLSTLEAVILASIVEREAVVEEDMPLIASVFINRLNIGMKLDADPTVQYALGFNPAQNTWWTNPLSLSDLECNSLYNTYRSPGLPPGPISNPGINALRAVAFPAQTPYYYFRVGCDGSGRHVFAETFQEHKLNACP